MNRNLRLVPITIAALWAATGCTNPTVDPAASFSAIGRGLDANGSPLSGAQVKLVRYYDRAKLLQPSVDDLFNCTGDCSYNDLGFEIAVVRTAPTDMSGNFRFDFKGADIAARNGVTDSQGKVEGSNLVIVFVDPSDMTKKAGVFSFDYVFQQADKQWGAGDFKLWASNATADVSGAGSSGLVKFSWDKLNRPSGSAVNNYYRLEVSGTNSARLVIQCLEGVSRTEGGCDTSGNTVSTYISAFSLYTWYSDAGTFSAYVRGDGADYRFRSKFAVPMPVPDPRPNRSPIALPGIWAVGGMGTAPQSLLNTAATDGNPQTRQAITNNATAIYVQIPAGTLITDAGLLNSLVKSAYAGCVVVEFNTTTFNTIDDATAATQGWTQKGKFCGGQGADNEISALLSFDTSTSAGETAAWLRFNLLASDGVTSLNYLQIGEVALYQKSMH